MNATKSDDPNALVVPLGSDWEGSSKEVIRARCSKLLKTLEGHACSALILDCKRITHLTRDAVIALHEVKSAADVSGKPFRVTGVSPQLKTVLGRLRNSYPLLPKEQFAIERPSTEKVKESGKSKRKEKEEPKKVDILRAVAIAVGCIVPLAAGYWYVISSQDNQVEMKAMTKSFERSTIELSGTIRRTEFGRLIPDRGAKLFAIQHSADGQQKFMGSTVADPVGWYKFSFTNTNFSNKNLADIELIVVSNAKVPGVHSSETRRFRVQPDVPNTANFSFD